MQAAFGQSLTWMKLTLKGKAESTPPWAARSTFSEGRYPIEKSWNGIKIINNGT
jgi:hypothetical protein